MHERSDEAERRLQRTREVLQRIHAVTEGQAGVEVSLASVLVSSESYLVRRGVLGALLEQRWIVRHGRDRVALTTRGLEEAQRLASRD